MLLFLASGLLMVPAAAAASSAKPEFVQVDFPQITNNAVTVRWKTDRKTNATLSYRSAKDKKDKVVKYKTYEENHIIYLYKLTPETGYNLTLTAKDKNGATSTRFLAFSTLGNEKAVSKLIVSNVRPNGTDDKTVSSRSATISWKTNLMAKTRISYGTSPGKYDHKIGVSKSRQFNHRVELTGLAPNTTYYFKISAYGALYNKEIKTTEMSFTTKPISRPLLNGSIVKGSDYKVYVINNGKKFWIKNPAIFTSLGYKWNWIVTVEDVVLAGYPDGKTVGSSSKRPDGTVVKYNDSNTVYLLDGGKKRPFASPSAFLSRGYNWNKIIIIPNYENYPTGDYLI